MKIAEKLHGFLWRDQRANNGNTYFIEGPPRILIDPGHRHLFGRVETELARLALKPAHMDIVVATHAHPDHLEALSQFREPTLTALGREEYDFIRGAARQAGWDWGGEGPEPDLLLQEGELKLGELRFRILVTPGHSPGSICLYWEDQKALFTGDVLFQQGLGRTDLPGGNGAMLKESIRRLAALEVDILLPGHGEVIMGKAAVQANFRMVEDYWFNYI
ncbi:MAG: MBL fold metallo-hydrolase [Desulfobacterota bacterium]|jgi:glyoxylase-like metal-dependent hydrolase (beta-lactamase superfamily II)|nr:MBL fold metallo-hydrolase [Thermodesulfobacteriota bacterium]